MCIGVFFKLPLNNEKDLKPASCNELFFFLLSTASAAMFSLLCPFVIGLDFKRWVGSNLKNGTFN